MTLSKSEIAIIGCGGHARSLVPVLIELGLSIDGIFDDSYDDTVPENISGVELKGSIKDCSRRQNALIALGNPKQREQYYTEGFNYTGNVIHPSAIIVKDVELGNANQIFPMVFINSFSKVGDNNLINSCAIIEHECQLGSHNHISVGAKICGRVQIGDSNMIGAGAIVIDNIKIASDIIIGAGAVVVSDLLEPGTYVGNPAKKIK